MGGHVRYKCSQAQDWPFTCLPDFDNRRSSQRTLTDPPDQTGKLCRRLLALRYLLHSTTNLSSFATETDLCLQPSPPRSNHVHRLPCRQQHPGFLAFRQGQRRCSIVFIDDRDVLRFHRRQRTIFGDELFCGHSTTKKNCLQHRLCQSALLTLDRN